MALSQTDIELLRGLRETITSLLTKLQTPTPVMWTGGTGTPNFWTTGTCTTSVTYPPSPNDSTEIVHLTTALFKIDALLGDKAATKAILDDARKRLASEEARLEQKYEERARYDREWLMNERQRLEDEIDRRVEEAVDAKIRAMHDPLPRRARPVDIPVDKLSHL